MKITQLVSLAAFSLALVGCADTHRLVLDSAKRPPTRSVEVFKDGAQPAHPGKPIAELSWKGPQEDELKAQEYFMKEAQKIGGNAIVFERGAGNRKFSFGWGGSIGGATEQMEFLFKAKVLAYE